MALTYVKIASATVGAGGASSIDFNTIPTTYDDLVIKLSLRSTDSAETAINLRFNGSAGSAYNWRSLAGNGASASSGNASSVTEIFGGRMPSSSYTASTFSNNEVYIPNYRSSTNKSVSIDSVNENNSSTALMVMVAGLRAVTDAITSINFSAPSGNFAQHSTAVLYGISRT